MYKRKKEKRQQTHGCGTNLQIFYYVKAEQSEAPLKDFAFITSTSCQKAISSTNTLQHYT